VRSPLIQSTERVSERESGAVGLTRELVENALAFKQPT
jgi:hypothetical protein